jgi:hypothetical protein
VQKLQGETDISLVCVLLPRSHENQKPFGRDVSSHGGSLQQRKMAIRRARVTADQRWVWVWAASHGDSCVCNVPAVDPRALMSSPANSVLEARPSKSALPTCEKTQKAEANWP